MAASYSVPLGDGREKDDSDGGSTSFVAKMSKMLENAEHAPYIKWGVTNASIVIPDPVAFADKVIPHYFKHNNFTSFVRQLNLYGFHKTIASASDGDMCEFQHQYFTKHDKELRKLIKRKCTEKSNAQQKQQQFQPQMQPQTQHDLQQHFQQQQQHRQQQHFQQHLQQHHQNQQGAGADWGTLQELQTSLADVKMKLAYFQAKSEGAARQNQSLTQELTLMKRSLLSHEEKIANLTGVVANLTKSLLLSHRPQQEQTPSCAPGVSKVEQKGDPADLAAAEVGSVGSSLHTNWIASKRPRTKEERGVRDGGGEVEQHSDAQAWMEQLSSIASLVHDRQTQDAACINLSSMSSDALGSVSSTFNSFSGGQGNAAAADLAAQLGSVGNAGILGSVGHGGMHTAQTGIFPGWNQPQLDSQTLTQSLLQSLVKQGPSSSHFLGPAGVGQAVSGSGSGALTL
uniref:HSF-type DNA-binding domain-containing protein n=2 Tax=Hemiselmis andersenii TaxID=464988 RepID=A0A6U2BLK6_HEMAN|mmetsp:Transcript_16000/g.36938  ORF Transcript_16000/g.36938 Transcript_16000/m.36938 type:complete len:456 (+) Transcript_16000:44-1411(+)